MSRRTEPRYDDDADDSHGRQGLAPDLSRVLIASNTQINRIVVSSIVQGCGLKAVTEPPATAVRVLPLLFPALVVVDGGADGRDCDILVDGILALRRVCASPVPGVILLATGAEAPGLPLRLVVDAVVRKPFTGEQVQPVIEQLLGRARALSRALSRAPE